MALAKSALIRSGLAILQRLAGDTAGAKATAEEALKTLESLDERQPGNPNIVHGAVPCEGRAGREGLGPQGCGTRNHACAE